MIRARLVALLGVLALAAALRFTGLSWGLRHTPHWDERVFVENARAMVAAGDLDHRYYEYPGLFFYLVYPVLALVPDAALEGPGAYVVVRGVVAAFGVLSVGLAWLLGDRLAGPWAGAAAAALLAVSPNEVITAHMVRPDVVLGAFVLLAVLAFRGLGQAPRGDLVAGVAIGAATAVKFTGVLLAPSYVAARLAAPGPRVGRILVAGATAMAVALLATPYALIHAGAYLDGVSVQWTAHYKGRTVTPSYLQQMAFYLGAIAWSFGPVGAALVAAGTAFALREWRTWAPALAHPLATLAVLATAELRYERHLVPTSGLLALLAGRAVAALGERWPKVAAVVVAAAVALPLAGSVAYVNGVSGPMTKDRALDWIEAHVPQGGRVVTMVPDLGLDRTRIEVVRETSWEPTARLLARDADFVVTAEPETLARRGLRPLALFAAERRWGGATLAVAVPEPRPAYQAIPLEGRRLSASEGTDALPALLDDRLDTFWQTSGPQRAQSFIQADLEAPARLARVELVLGDRAQLFAGYLQLHGTTDGTTWRRLAVVEGRPPVDSQVARPQSQVLLLDPVEVRGVRLLQMGKRRRPWAVAELRLQALGP